MSPTLVALCACLLLGALHVVLPWLVLQARRRRLQAACRQRRAIVLTFDDGPSRLLTPLVVDRLNEAGVRATFFLLGERTLGNEDTVHEIARHGHELGSHGNTHVHHIWSWPWDGIFDTRAGWRILRATTGRGPHELPFRPPYGKLNLLSMLFVLWKRGPVAMWTHDCGDTRDSDQPASRDLVDAVRRDGGGVVLMHDFDRSTPAEGEQMLATLDAVLQLKREGFTFLRIGDLLSATERPSTAAV
jgi:peptidoglycan-N-acetylglucosamine deacetylase